MKPSLSAAVAVLLSSFALTAHGADVTVKPTHTSRASGPAPIFTNYPDMQWKKIIPSLGDDSPEMSILHVNPKTKATKLLIRSPTAIHVRKHWHTANETHTVITGNVVFQCDGKRAEQVPGSFSYMPAKMVHEAWVPAGSLVFVTVDGPWDVHWVEGAPTRADLTK